ncbi:hypothetical protein GGR56DRAFT_613579 [Xylariaceae sp. FL0804]|nr:hypothetical protein GGR56DRAFT_613579 [Xylariaceae sp. FL0804]
MITIYEVILITTTLKINCPHPCLLLGLPSCCLQHAPLSIAQPIVAVVSQARVTGKHHFAARVSSLCASRQPTEVQRDALAAQPQRSPGNSDGCVGKLLSKSAGPSRPPSWASPSGVDVTGGTESTRARNDETRCVEREHRNAICLWLACAVLCSCSVFEVPLSILDEGRYGRAGVVTRGFCRPLWSNKPIGLAQPINHLGDNLPEREAVPESRLASFRRLRTYLKRTP